MKLTLSLTLRSMLPLALAALGTCAWAQTAPPKFPDAQATDPIALSWMMGEPGGLPQGLRHSAWRRDVAQAC